MGFFRSRKPIPASPTTLALPVLVLLAGIGHVSYVGTRIAAKAAADGRQTPCVVKELAYEPVVVGNGQQFAPRVQVIFTDTTANYDAFFHRTKEGLVFPTQASALTKLGYSSVDGVVEYTLFKPGEAPPAPYGCYAFHADDGAVTWVQLSRTRAPVLYDMLQIVGSSLVILAAGVFVTWVFVNHQWRTGLGREIGVVRVMAVGMNYTDCRTDGISELTGITDSDNFIKMCEDANVTDITYLTDTNYLLNAAVGLAPTKHVVLSTMASIAERCSSEDMFIFFYAGHGDNVDDEDGDEDDGKDEAFVLMDSTGACSFDATTYLVDDEFSDGLMNFPLGCRILIVTDCCHSGTIADLDNEGKYGERPIVHIAGTQDHQEAADTGKGGAATTAMLQTIAALEEGKGAGKYSVKEVFTRMQKWLITQGYTDGSRVDPDLQNITLNWTPSCDPGKMPWPITRKGFVVGTHTNIAGGQPLLEP